MPKECANSAAVTRVVIKNPRSVGYIDKTAVDSSFSVAYEFE